MDEVRATFAPDVEAELADARFVNRKHGTRSTHTAGCHGPLCRLAETLRGRRRNEERAVDANREYQPGKRRARNDERLKELLDVIDWHHRDHEERKRKARNERIASVIDAQINHNQATIEKLLEARQAVAS